jgi:hypothetical protein
MSALLTSQLPSHLARRARGRVLGIWLTKAAKPSTEASTLCSMAHQRYNSGTSKHTAAGMTAVRELLWRLGALGLPTTSGLALLGESRESARLRQLDALQVYSWRWDKHRLERLSADDLETAERQIVADAFRLLSDWRDCVEWLVRAGHPLLQIAMLTRVPMQTLYSCQLCVESELRAAEPICAPASAVRH